MDRYQVGPPPNAEDPKQLLDWLLQELERVSIVINNVAPGKVDVLHVAPTKPREGMIRMADGTDWNPGSGKGYYGYKSGAWVFLG